MHHSDSTTKFQALCCGRLAPSKHTIGHRLSAAAARRSAGSAASHEKRGASAAAKCTKHDAHSATTVHHQALANVVGKIARRADCSTAKPSTSAKLAAAGPTHVGGITVTPTTIA